MCEISTQKANNLKFEKIVDALCLMPSDEMITPSFWVNLNRNFTDKNKDERSKFLVQ